MRGHRFAKTLVCKGFGAKKSVLHRRYFRLFQNGKSVQNVKNQFFHQLSWRGIGVVQTLTFGIYFSNFRNYLHHFHSGVISESRHVVLRSPWISQLQPVSNSLLALFLRRIIGDHQILEITEEHWEKLVDVACLGIIVKIFYYLISLENIAIDNGILKLE